MRLIRKLDIFQIIYQDTLAVFSRLAHVPSSQVCSVCNENFDVFWDQEEEEWMLRDAVMVQDKVYHPICQEDAGKEFSVGNVSFISDLK